MIKLITSLRIGFLLSQSLMQHNWLIWLFDPKLIRALAVSSKSSSFLLTHFQHLIKCSKI